MAGPVDDGWKGNAATRCTAHRKNGDRCKRQARRGASVCNAHGGRAPQVKRRAQQRLDEAADRMARALLGIATNGESEAARVSAIKHALALAGLSEKTAVTVEVEPAPWQQIAALGGIARISRDESHARRALTPPPRELTAGEAAEPLDVEAVPEPDPPGQPEPDVRPPFVREAEATGRPRHDGELTMEQAARAQAEIRALPAPPPPAHAGQVGSHDRRTRPRLARCAHIGPQTGNRRGEPL